MVCVHPCRLDAVGMAAFFGDSTGGKAAVSGVEWFACAGMRLGEAAGKGTRLGWVKRAAGEG